MSQWLEIELYLPAGRVTRPGAALIVKALQAAGFVLEQEVGYGLQYWAGPDLSWHTVEQVDEAWAAFDRSVAHELGWGLMLWKERLNGELVNLIASFERAPEDDQYPFDRVRLATHLAMNRTVPPLSHEFLGWAVQVAALSRPWYGRGGNSSGLYDFTPVSPAALAALEPQSLEWLNIYGPRYTERLGLDRLLSVPAWQVQILADDSVAVILGPDIIDISVEDARRIAEHLDIPGPPRSS